MGLLQRIVRNLDRRQRRKPWLAFPYAVVRKFGDDQAGSLAALVAYYGFFSLFPLLLALVAVLGIALRGNPELQRRVLHSALAEFPVIGTEIERNVGSLGAGNGPALVVGIAGTLWSGIGVINSLQNAMNTVWNVPYRARPNLLRSTARALLMLGVLGIATLGSAAMSGLAAESATWWGAVLGVAGSLGLNFAVFLMAFRILTSAEVSWAEVRPGAAAGAVAWTILLASGGYYVGHQLRGASEVYGAFAVVIGLLAWMYLGAQVTLLAAEINVVKARSLWPRAMQPPLTEADDRALRYYATQEERRPGERVWVRLRREDPVLGRGSSGAGVEEPPGA